MASSPLTLAMLGNGGGFNIQDPAYLPATRKLGLAQGLIGQGLDSSSAYPAQALARAVQAGLGAWLMKSGESDFEGVNADRQKAAQDAIAYMRGGSPALPAQPAAPTPPPALPQSPSSAPSNFSANIAGGESGGNANATNPLFPPERGGPAGPQQFIASTWNSFAKANPQFFTGMSPDQVLAARTDPNLSTIATHWLAGQNAPVLQGAGIEPTPQNLGVAHALGGRGASMVLKLPDEMPLSQAFAQTQPDSAKAILAENPQYQNMTVGQLKQKYAGVGGTQYAAAGNIATDAGTAPPPLPQSAPTAAPVPGATPAPQPGAAQPGAPQTGMHAPMVQQALTMMQRAQEMAAANPYNVAIQHAAAAQIEYAKQLMSLDQFVTNPDGTQVNARTGQRMGAAAPLPQYVQSPTGSHDVTGTHPDTYMPAPRVYQTPAGNVGAVGPGGQVTPLAAADNAGVAARAAAGAQGAETGKSAVTTINKMADLGHESDAAIGNIDYGMNQLHQASQGGIQAGYFAPWLATAAAAGKSLGIDLNKLGVDPAAVGNIQSAQKTLGVVAGSILQNTIGKDSQITDAKIEHFIHTQPGIETDPQAIDRILNWARSQFVYNRDMAMDAMKNTNPETGMLPPGWRASFYTRKGAFAPIYDPLGGEMRQPSGEGPPAVAPAPQGAPAPAATTGQPQSPAAVPAPPVAGARQAPDGNWYLPDPKRPGKYLQVK